MTENNGEQFISRQDLSRRAESRGWIIKPPTTTDDFILQQKHEQVVLGTLLRIAAATERTQKSVEHIETMLRIVLDSDLRREADRAQYMNDQWWTLIRERIIEMEATHGPMPKNVRRHVVDYYRKHLVAYLHNTYSRVSVHSGYHPHPSIYMSGLRYSENCRWLQYYPDPPPKTAKNLFAEWTAWRKRRVNRKKRTETP